VPSVAAFPVNVIILEVFFTVTQSYFEIVQLIERLHRHFLDVLRSELRTLNIDDINAVQALLLSNIGNDDVVIRDLKDRGYYHGSNVSYNIKKLQENGYIEQERCTHDRRAIRIKMTQKGQDLCNSINALQTYLAETIDSLPKLAAKLEDTSDALSRLERVWTNYIRYGRD
jgi:DNA-binding MarR family transcriptional regulator